MKRNIIIVSRNDLAFSNIAASARMKNYAKALSRSKDAVAVYMFSEQNYGSDVVSMEQGSIFVSQNKSVGHSFAQTVRFVSFLIAFSKRLKGEKIYLFYPSDNPCLEILFLFVFKIILRRKIFCEINEVRKYSSISIPLSPIKRSVRKLINACMELVKSFYDGLICISLNISEYFKPRNKNRIIVPILSDSPDVVNLEKKQSQILNFSFTGTMSVRKENLVELINGFCLLDKEYQNWCFNLYGFGSESDKKELLDIVEKLQLSEKIKFRGEVPHNEIYGILNGADCLILSRENNKQNYYGFSTKLSEYAVSGTPIIMTDTGVVSLYFKNLDNCIMVEGYDGQAFYKSLKVFVEMSVEERRKLANNAYATAKRFFDWRDYCDVLNDFLK